MFKLPEVKKEMDFLFGNIPSRSTLPILSVIAIKQSNLAVELRTTDLETHSVVNLPAVHLTKTDEKMKTAAILTKKIPRESNTVEYKNNRVFWNKIPLVTKDYKEVPYCPKITRGKTLPKEIVDAIYKAVLFCSKDELKPALTGIHVYNRSTVRSDKFDKVIVESTNGHQIYKKTIDIKTRSKFNIILPRIIVPRLKKLLRLGELSKITLGEWNGRGDYVKFAVGEHCLITRLIDERYPSVNAVIPRLNTLTKVPFETKPTFDSFDYIRNVAPINKETHQIILNGTQVECRDLGRDLSMGLSIPLKVPIRIGFNIEYIHPILKSITAEKCDWYFSTPTGITLIIPRKEKEIYVVMPVHIN